MNSMLDTIYKSY